MGIDIRTPVGVFFGLLGVILLAYGAISDASVYAKSLGININFAWGLVLFVFGLVMAFFGRRASRAASSR